MFVIDIYDPTGSIRFVLRSNSLYPRQFPLHANMFLRIPELPRDLKPCTISSYQNAH